MSELAYERGEMSEAFGYAEKAIGLASQYGILGAFIPSSHY